MIRSALRVMILMLLCNGTAGMAAPIQLFSGEHGDFTRLVISSGAIHDWVLGRIDGGYELRLTGTNATFDLSQAFNKITHDRLVDLAAPADGGRLQLLVPKDVSATAMALADGKIVIDLKTGHPADRSPFEKRLPDLGAGAQKGIAPSQGSAAHAPYPGGTIPFLADGNRDSTLPLYWRHALQTNEAAPAAVGPPPASPETAPKENSASDPDRAPGVLAVEMELLRQLGRAASQGLVTVPNPAERRHLRHLPPSDPAPRPAEVDDHIEFHVETGIDATGREGAKPQRLTSEGTECPDAALTDMAGWDQKDGVPLTLARARSDLVGEFDRPDPAAVLQLVHFYMASGLGAEAQNAISAFKSRIPDADLLSEIAGLMDGQPPSQGSRLAKLASCDTSIALWAVLAASDDRARGNTNFEAVIRGFSGLPPSLRNLTANALSQHLIDAGRAADAASIRNAIARSEPSGEGNVLLLDARIEASFGQDRDALARYRRLAERDDAPGAEATQRVLELQLASGATVDAATVDRVAALAFEHRTDSQGPALASLEIRARGALGDFPEAFRRLTEVRTTLPNADFSVATDDLFARAAENAADSVFLKAVYGSPSNLTRLGSRARLAVATRLIHDGLASRATAILGDLSDTSDGRLLRARAALQQFDPATAQSLLAGLNNPDAQDLRVAAAALGASGNTLSIVPAVALDAAAVTDSDLGKALRKLGYSSDGPNKAEVAAPPTLEAGRAEVAGAQTLATDIAALLEAAKTPGEPPDSGSSVTESQ